MVVSDILEFEFLYRRTCTDVLIIDNFTISHRFDPDSTFPQPAQLNASVAPGTPQRNFGTPAAPPGSNLRQRRRPVSYKFLGLLELHNNAPLHSTGVACGV